MDIIAKKANADRATLSRATELSTIDMDSLDFVEIVFDIEEKFDISLPYNANESAAVNNAKFKTIGDVIDIVAKEIK